MVIRIGVGNTDPAKIEAVKEAFEACFPGESINAHGVYVPSGVYDQPMTLEETILGAQNRARGAMSLLPANEFWVGMEGGVHLIGEEPYECGRICVVREELGSAIAMSQAGTFDLPLGKGVYRLLLEGVDLKVALEMLTGHPKQESRRGFQGYVTNDLIGRQQAYVQAVIAALSIFLHPELS